MTAVADDDGDIESSRAPLLDHLVELRTRLIVCVVALVIAFIGCFALAEPIYLILLKPFETAAALLSARKAGLELGMIEQTLTLMNLRPAPSLDSATINLIYTAPLEILFTKMKLAAFGAICVTFPVLAWQLYRFVAPGLYRKEKKAFLPFLLASPALFTLGGALVYFVILPFVMWFSLSQQIVTGNISVALLPKVSDYLTLVTTLLLAFGLCFQLPVVVALLGLAGIVDSGQLRAGRRYAIVGVFVVAAVVTPPDPISQLMLAIPICLLYEVSIWCVRLIEVRRRREDEVLA